MASDDLFVVYYYILKYLYECLKMGTEPEEEILNLSKYKVKLNDVYILQIYKNLYNDGYIDGVDIVSVSRLGTRKRGEFIRSFADIMITTKGVEFLSENSLMNKAREFLKDFSGILPW